MTTNGRSDPKAMTASLMIRALCGEAMPKTARGQALWACRRERATRAWLTVGSYGWWRYTGFLKAAQQHLLSLRPAQGTEAGTAETGTGSVHDGPVHAVDAP